MLNARNGLGGLPQSLVAGANSLLSRYSNLQDASWPYWWVYPRIGTQFKQLVESIPTPAAATLTEVFEFTIPAGFVFILRGVRQTYQGTGFVDGSGSILWTLDVDTPTSSVGLDGYSLPDMGAMSDQRGSQNIWWPIEGFTVFGPYQTLRYKVLTDDTIPVGPPNYITCGIYGWFDQAL
jgi:hypothetical protein